MPQVGSREEVLQTLVVGEVGEQLLLELRPVATGDDGDLHDTQEVVQQGGDVGAEW